MSVNAGGDRLEQSIRSLDRHALEEDHTILSSDRANGFMPRNDLARRLSLELRVIASLQRSAYASSLRPHEAESLFNATTLSSAWLHWLTQADLPRWDVRHLDAHLKLMNC
jgi:hypothetical protein